MIFFCTKTTKHLDIRRDMKKILPVGCCIDKRQKSRGTKNPECQVFIFAQYISLYI